MALIPCGANAQVEYNWPFSGFSAYRIPDNDGDVIIVRDVSDNLAAKMVLTEQGADYHNKANIAQSYVYSSVSNVRTAYVDINRNGRKDGFIEDFDRLPEAADPNSLDDLNWTVFGLEHTDRVIKEMNGNKWLHIDFDSPAGMLYSIGGGQIIKAWVPFGVAQRVDFDPPIDISDSVISFDLKTSYLTEAIPGVLTVIVKARSYHPDTGADMGYISWRLQNYPQQTAWWRENVGLYDLPVSGPWQKVSFSVNDLVYNDTNESHWYRPDFSDVIQCEILVLQVPLSIYETENDWVAAGSVNIDNFSVGAETEVVEQTALNSVIAVSSFEDANGVQSVFYPGSEVNVTLAATQNGDVKRITMDLIVYDSSFSWPQNIQGVVYDSRTSGDSYTTYLGKSETEARRFSFRLPSNAVQGNYRVIGIMKDADTGDVLDTTGPDVSFSDETVLAYSTGFYVFERFTHSGPVSVCAPLNDTVPVGIEGTAHIAVDGSLSYHIQSPAYSVVLYEWDIFNDGSIDYSGAEADLDVNIDVSSLLTDAYSAEIPVSLKVTDNQSEPVSDTSLCTVTVTKDGSLRLTNMPSGAAKIILYAENGGVLNEINRKITNAGADVVWSALPAGAYCVTVLEYDSSPFNDPMMVMAENVFVAHNSESTVQFNENMPYITAVSFRYADTGETLGPIAPVFAGEVIEMVVQVENPSSEDSACKVTAFFDQSSTAPYDVTTRYSDASIIPASGNGSVVLPVSMPEPEETDVNTYYASIRLDSQIASVFRKVDSTSWGKALDILPLPQTRSKEKSISFSNIQWDVYDWAWQAGVYNKNVQLDNEGALHLSVRDYSGVGAQVNSARMDYHYGNYKVEMKATPTHTDLPEGAVLAFFYYWENWNSSEVQEIDVEIRSLHVSDGSAISYVDFTVHSKKAADSQIYNKTFVCPVANIDQYHSYEFRWKPDSVSFYIDGALASDQYGTPAVVNNTNFPGRIPQQPGSIIMNHWSGQKGNTWAGEPPQRKGDFTGTVKKVSITPGVRIHAINWDANLTPNVFIQSYPSLNVTLQGKDDTPSSTWVDLDTFSGSESYTFSDTGGAAKSNRLYKLIYDWN
ncbi:MAG: glycoside hydrolase family 16 protein [Candidatus Auribacterota bacterium]